jgi:group I intron endonuclease
MKKITGIYKIISPNNKIYIGQSKDIYSRWNAYKYFQRDYDCYKKRNKNSLIFKSFKKYGYENHKFEILEVCSELELNKKEIFYIKKYNSNVLNGSKTGLNLHKGGNKPPIKRKMSEEEKLKISLKNKENHKLGKYKKTLKSIIKTDIEGNFVKKYSSLTEMYKKENFSDSFFRNNFYEFNKLYKDNFIFKFENKNNFKYKIKTKKEKIKKEKIKKQKPKRTHEEFSAFFKKINTGRKHIKRKSPKKTDKFKKHIKKLHENNKTQVSQYDLNGCFIKNFSSINDAAKETNAKYQAIVRVCLGKRRSAYGYMWKYKHIQ